MDVRMQYIAVFSLARRCLMFVFAKRFKDKPAAVTVRSPFSPGRYLLSGVILFRRDSGTPHARTQTQANTNPNGTETTVAGRSVGACVARESKREESGGEVGRSMRLLGGRDVGECGSRRNSHGVA
jgi:hypothetical protein